MMELFMNTSIANRKMVNPSLTAQYHVPVNPTGQWAPVSDKQWKNVQEKIMDILRMV